MMRMRVLIAAAIIIAVQPHVEPVRWWRAPRVVAEMHLTAGECDEVDHLFEATLSAETPASLEATRAMDEIAKQLDDAFLEDRLLALTQRLVRAQADQAALERSLLVQANAVVTRHRRARREPFQVSVQTGDGNMRQERASRR